MLTGGGRVVGELVNRDESPRQRYVVQAADGAKVTLDAAQVQQVLHPRPEEAEYERIRPTYADTAAAQWELAQWCREHKLPKQREVHLRRVIELDPNHAEARHALGYSQLDGQWVTRDEVMTQRGYVKYKGKWMLPQEKELIEKKHEAGGRPAGVVPEAEALAWLAGRRSRPAGPREHPRHRRSGGGQGVGDGLARRFGPAGAAACTSRRWRRSIRPRPPGPWPSPRSPIRWKRSA